MNRNQTLPGLQETVIPQWYNQDFFIEEIVIPGRESLRKEVKYIHEKR